jgi:hypothetical protein
MTEEASTKTRTEKTSALLFSFATGLTLLVATVYPPQGIVWRHAAWELLLPLSWVAWLVWRFRTRIADLHHRVGPTSGVLGVVVVACLWIYFIWWLGHLPPEGQRLLVRQVIHGTSREPQESIAVVTSPDDSRNAMPEAPLRNPFEVMEERNRELESQLAAALKRIELLETNAATPVREAQPEPTRPVAEDAAAEPAEEVERKIPPPPRDLRITGVPREVTIKLGPALDTSCALIGSQPTDSRPVDFLNVRLPPLRERFDSLVQRTVAAVKIDPAQNPKARDVVRQGWRAWNGDAGQAIRNAFDQTARIDFDSTPPSDIALNQIPADTRALLLTTEGSVVAAMREELREATAKLQCMLAIADNIRKNHPQD